jgi:hypothetical protein
MQNITTNEVLRKRWNAKGGPQLRQATLGQKLKTYYWDPIPKSRV